MKAYIITMSDSEYSLQKAQVCEESLHFCKGVEINRFEATQPKDIKAHTKEVFGRDIPWTWPLSESQNQLDFKSGLFKRAYAAKDQNRVIACALSHYRLWKLCTEEPILILEHDAIFIRDLDLNELNATNWGALGLNNPIGNTRKGLKYDEMVFSMGPGIHRVPCIDEPGEPPLPMGLAGNSAYIIKPTFAKKLLKEVENLGMWPNDAIMCRQLFPELKVVYPYSTKVQKGLSTTQGI